ncbi:MAG: tRNA (guanosine(37)-N1)-methyltransferase TrmD, partial [Caldimonas sp.]
HYTRPPVVEGLAVPEVLLSGNHAAIDAWRREQSLALTADRRPDLLAGARAEGLLDATDEAYLARRPPAKL